MMKILLLIALLTLSHLAYGQAESKCFEADVLSGGHTITFKIAGNKIAGTFTVESNDRENVKTYEFTGTRVGDVIKVKFAENEMPDLTPSSQLKSLSWTLVTTGDNESLRIKLYGKNYVTNKYKDYFANFESCEPTYGALLKLAENVRLLGKHSPPAGVAPSLSYGERISFKVDAPHKVFLMNVFKDRTLDIDAAGCTISVYLPNGKLYEIVEWEAGSEKTFTSSTIDRLTIKSTPQTGKYMVVLKAMAPDARPEIVKFRSYQQAN